MRDLVCVIVRAEFTSLFIVSSAWIWCSAYWTFEF